MIVRIAVTALFIATALVGSASSSTPPSGGSSSSRPSIYTTTPGYTNPRDAVVADVLLDRIVFSDGVQVQSSEFVYPGQVLNLTYNGPLARFRVQNGPLASVGTPGLRYIEAEDGNSASISAQDRVMFADRLELAWANANLNNRAQLQTQAGYGYILIGVLLQGALVLPVMPSEEGADIWRDACGVDPRGGAASTLHIHDPKDAAAVLSISARIAQATLSHRASMRE